MCRKNRARTVLGLWRTRTIKRTRTINMSLFLATLLPGLLLAALGGALFWPGAPAAAKSLPRSAQAAWVLFGAGAACFLWRLSRTGEADLIFFQTPLPVIIGFGAL